MKTFLTLSIVGLFVAIIYSCNCEQSENNLGCNLYIMEGDCVEDRIIVYCNSIEFCDCYAGSCVIPSSARHMRNGKYSEYVESARANDDWISVKIKQIVKDKYNYWVIIKDDDLENLDRYNSDFDSILQSHIYGPVEDPEEFLFLLNR